MTFTYSKRILKLFDDGNKAAQRLNHTCIAPEHLIMGFTFGSLNHIRTLLIHFGVNIDLIEMRAAYAICNRYRDHQEPTEGDTFAVTLITKGGDEEQHTYHLLQDTVDLIGKANSEAAQLNSREVCPEHFLLAMLGDAQSSLSKILAPYNVDYAAMRQYMEQSHIADDDKTPDAAPEAQQQAVQAQESAAEAKEQRSEGSGSVPPPPGRNRYHHDSEDDEDDATDINFRNFYTHDGDNGDDGNKNSMLARYCTDLTAAAEQGLLDPVVGRERELEQVTQTLLRRKKNNPVLIGEPGVGKTAVVEALAMRIVKHQVSWALQKKRIYTLSLAALVAGTKYRGMFEERIMGLLDEVRQNPDVIIFIDEIHTLVGTGGAGGTADAANILKPALARGEFQCIGATTFDEYRNSFEKDGALERRFQKVTVDAPTADETLTILRNVKERYEQHHNVRYTDAALETCVRMTERYISDRNFPDKAIDALDEAGARAHALGEVYPARLAELEEELLRQKALKEKAAEEQNYTEAAAHRDAQCKLEHQCEVLRREWDARRANTPTRVVDAADVAHVVSVISGVPVEKAMGSESARLLQLKAELDREVIGQGEAVQKIVRAIQRSRVGLSDPNRPLGSFLFVGPTGVGKTLLARTLAREMFLSESSFIRLDMSEYSEQYAVSRMVGAPPGYVGYDKGGQLAEEVRRHPYSVVLFDEIEKAHPSVFNMLLQILDDGRLTDSFGRTVNFKNTVIIMTSNVGSRKLKEFGTGIGFNVASELRQKELSENLIQKEVRRTFSPEFLNRIDGVVMFNHLQRADIRTIVNVELDKALKRVRDLGLNITVDDSVKDFLADRGYDPDLGARPLRRAIQTYIEDEMCDTLLELSLAEHKEAYTVSVQMGEEKPVISFRCTAEAAPADAAQL
jgi:ATP-dependent Clp protease ATP-binding subunit ClpC